MRRIYAAILAVGKPHQAPTDPTRIVTMRELDAQLVAAAGLLPSARTIRLAARDAGLGPTDMLGTETIDGLDGSTMFVPEKHFDSLKTVYKGASVTGDKMIEVPADWEKGVFAVSPDVLSDDTFVAVK